MLLKLALGLKSTLPYNFSTGVVAFTRSLCREIARRSLQDVILYCHLSTLIGWFRSRAGDRNVGTNYLDIHAKFYISITS